MISISFLQGARRQLREETTTLLNYVLYFTISRIVTSMFSIDERIDDTEPPSKRRYKSDICQSYHREATLVR